MADIAIPYAVARAVLSLVWYLTDSEETALRMFDDLILQRKTLAETIEGLRGELAEELLRGSTYQTLYNLAEAALIASEAERLLESRMTNDTTSTG